MANQTKGRNKDHDLFIRGMLALEALALLLLRRFVPMPLQAFIDFPSIKSLSDAHIDNKLLAQYSDCIHECALLRERLPEEIRNDPDLPIFRFCFLWEHKSYKPYTPIEAQMERYRYALIGGDLKNNRTPSIVIPILLYHGETKWDKKMIYEKFEKYFPPEILAYMPRPQYIIIDIQAMTEGEIEKMVDLGVLRAAFITLKNAQKRNFFKQDMGKALKFVEDLPTGYMFQEFFKMLLEYMQRRSDLETDEFDNIVQQNMNQDMATSVKTMFEVAEERAELRGKECGEKQSNRLTALSGKFEGLPTKTLVRISRLPYTEIEMLLKGYEQVKEMWQKKDFENKKIEYLSTEEVNYLLEMFDENHH